MFKSGLGAALGTLQFVFLIIGLPLHYMFDMPMMWVFVPVWILLIIVVVFWGIMGAIYKMCS
jgi:hypothetical protein